MTFRLMLIAALFVLSSPGQTSAHEGHRENLSDAEMAGMPSSLGDNGQACMEACMEEASRTERGHEGHWMTLPEADEAAAVAPDSVGDLALEAARERNQVSSISSIGDFLGRIHPAAVHFPVALLLVAAFAEILLALKPMLGLGATVRFLVGTGAIGAVFAAFLGWFAGGWRLGDRSEMLAMHRWNGTGIALVSLLAWWLAGCARESRTLLRAILAFLAIALIAQGYLGGEMVFGPNHLGLEG